MAETSPKKYSGFSASCLQHALLPSSPFKIVCAPFVTELGLCFCAWALLQLWCAGTALPLWCTGFRGGGFSCWGTQASFPHSKWNLPRSGIKPMPPASAGGVSTTGPPGRSSSFSLNINLSTVRNGSCLHVKSNRHDHS